jgi:hypothetical protein
LLSTPGRADDLRASPGDTVPFQIRSSFLFAAALIACGSAPLDVSQQAEVAEASLTTRGTLQPQGFIHDTVDDHRKEAAWAFTGKAGDIVAPDVWPTGSVAQRNDLHPVLTLLGPAKSGKRPVLARGSPRSADERHLSIDGFTLPKAGSYLVVVGQAAAGLGGEFTLRFWTSASHAPRPEKAQLDLALAPSDAMARVIAERRAGGPRAGQPWTDEQVEAAISIFIEEPQLLTAFSDAEQLTLQVDLDHREGRATDAQLQSARQAATTLVGRPGSFAALPAQQQAFALYWLGELTAEVFEAQDVPPESISAPLRNVQTQLDALQAAWDGAQPYGDRHVRALVLGGAIYGYVAEWSCAQNDLDGRPVFAWWSTDYFDKSGRWLGEQSAGATEPEDDD